MIPIDRILFAFPVVTMKAKLRCAIKRHAKTLIGALRIAGVFEHLLGASLFFSEMSTTRSSLGGSTRTRSN